ncbi:hypothetical protein RKD48_003820 [Streptomyces ambofaciens]
MWSMVSLIRLSILPLRITSFDFSVSSVALSSTRIALTFFCRRDVYAFSLCP